MLFAKNVNFVIFVNDNRLRKKMIENKFIKLQFKMRCNLQAVCNSWLARYFILTPHALFQTSFCPIMPDLN